MSAAEELTPAEREFITRLLLKLTGGPVVAPQPQPVVAKPTAEDFAELRSIRRKRERRHG